MPSYSNYSQSDVRTAPRSKLTGHEQRQSEREAREASLQAYLLDQSLQSYGDTSETPHQSHRNETHTRLPNRWNQA